MLNFTFRLENTFNKTYLVFLSNQEIEHIFIYYGAMYLIITETHRLASGLRNEWQNCGLAAGLKFEQRGVCLAFGFRLKYTDATIQQQTRYQ